MHEVNVAEETFPLLNYTHRPLAIYRGINFREKCYFYQNPAIFSKKTL